MICPGCGIRKGVQTHHKFSQTKINVMVYGRKLIDADFNTVKYCEQCHGSHRNVKKEHLWNEQKFRDEAVKAGYDLPAGTKSFQNKVKFYESN